LGSNWDELSTHYQEGIDEWGEPGIVRQTIFKHVTEVYAQLDDMECHSDKIGEDNEAHPSDNLDSVSLIQVIVYFVQYVQYQVT